MLSVQKPSSRRHRKPSFGSHIVARVEQAAKFRLSLLLALCIILGGTAQNIATFKAPLYVISILFLVWILCSPERRPLNSLLRLPILILAALPLLYGIYSFPLPSTFWSELSGRDGVAEVYVLMGQSLPKLPISLYAERTAMSLFDFLPAIAVMVTTILTEKRKEVHIAMLALLCIGVVSVILGLIQIALGGSTLRLYTNFTPNRPVGFFSNTNHFALLCACLMPVAFWYQSGRAKIGDWSQSSNASVGLISLFVLATAILLSGSSAGYVLFVISLTFSGFIFIRKKQARRVALGFWGLAFVVILVDVFFLDGVTATILNKISASNVVSRSQIYTTSLMAISEGSAFGYGPGSFKEVYKTFENTDVITRGVVNEAHNEYLQLWFELGYFGIAIWLGLLLWLGWTVVRLVTLPKQSYIRSKVALIALALIALHSGVDYPLRTIAISSVACFFVAIIVRQSDKLNSRNF